MSVKWFCICEISQLQQRNKTSHIMSNVPHIQQLFEGLWGFFGFFCFLFFWPTVFGSGLIRFLTVCVDMNDSICFLSVCLNWTVTQQSTQCSVHKAEQQELITETLCDERPACNISKHRREDVGCVLSGSDVPRWLYV